MMRYKGQTVRTVAFHYCGKAAYIPTALPVSGSQFDTMHVIRTLAPIVHAICGRVRVWSWAC